MKRIKIFFANLGLRSAAFPLITPPLGILSLAAFIRKKFPVDIAIVNQKLQNATPGEIAKKAHDFQADVVGLSVMTPGSYQLAEVTQRIRQKLPGCLIVLGGPHVSAFQEEALRGTSADVAVRGEGELVFEQIIQAYLDQNNYENVPALIRQVDSNTIVTNPGATELISDLDMIPFPAYDLIDLKMYWKLQSVAPIPDRKYVSLMSSRGCPYNCFWCHDVFGKIFRTHSAERIADEIEFFTQKYGIRDVEFLDDVFNLKKERVLAIADEVNKRGISIDLLLPNGIRTDILTSEVVEALASMNLSWCTVALETGSHRLQKYIGKNLKIPAFLEGVRLLAAKRILTNGVAMLGFPTETEDEMKMTIDTMCSSRCHTASFFTVMPFPNTRLYEIIKEKSPQVLKELNYKDAGLANFRANFSNVSDEIFLKYKRTANLKFFADPARLFRLIRDYPKPYRLVRYIPAYFERITKGFWDRG